MSRGQGSVGPRGRSVPGLYRRLARRELRRDALPSRAGAPAQLVWNTEPRELGLDLGRCLDEGSDSGELAEGFRCLERGDTLDEGCGVMMIAQPLSRYLTSIRSGPTRDLAFISCNLLYLGIGT